MKTKEQRLKSVISVLLVALMLFSSINVGVIPFAVTSFAWDGVTTSEPSYEDGIYQIGTAEELAWFSSQVNAGKTSYNAVLTADIDLSGQAFTPIGNNSNKYAGVFDGQEHTISNLYITTTSVDRGLFGKTSNATIKNINLSSVRIMTARTYTGTVVGVLNGGIIENCHVTGLYLETSNSYVGGIVGQTEGTSPSVINCSVTGTSSYKNISGKEHTGGIIGLANVATTITGCSVSNVSISGTGSVGGLVGRVAAASNISDCSTASITLNATAAYAGGFVGFINGGTVESCTATNISVSSTSSNAGGFAGEVQSGTIFTDCSLLSVDGFENTVAGTTYTGGFAGRVYSSTSSFKNCVVENITLKGTGSYSGGFVGEHNSECTFTDCTVSQVSVTGSATYRGGFIGYGNAKMTVENCYVYDADITGTQYCGGFAGEIKSASSVTKSAVVGLSMTTTSTYNGGFVGNLTGTANTLQYCYLVDAEINAGNANYAGGFIGYSQSNAHNVLECYAEIDSMNGTGTYTGSFVGRRATGVFTDCYVTEISGLPLIGSGTAGVADTTVTINTVTSQEIADGTLTAALNGVTEVWTQGEDGYPVIAEKAVSPEYVDGYYLIYNGYQLEWFMKFVNNGSLTSNAKLMADIDLHNKAWTPIGNDSKQFNAIFDGNGYTVSNVNISTTSVDRGFFGKTNTNAVIRNLTLENVTVTGARDYTGTLVGVINGSDVENCHVIGVSITTTNSRVGGLIGQVGGTAPTITNCSVTGTDTMNSISANQYIGGLVGYMNGAVEVKDSNVENLALTASNSSSYVGGLYGTCSESASTYENILVKDITLTGVNYMGGISYALCKTSSIAKAGVVNITITSTSTSAEARLGGFFGNIGWEGINSIQYCYAAGVTINAPSAGSVGGFVGYSNNKEHTYNECYAQVDSINSTNRYVGMFVGYRATGTFADCFVTGSDTYPLVGSSTAYVAGTQTGITAVTNEQIYNGELTDMLNDVTEIWQQHNNDYVNGYSEIGNAEPPVLNEEGYYEIFNSFQLRWFRDAVNDGQTAINAKLMADIDLKNREWMPIGNSSKSYTGTFDGNGFTVRNIAISTTSYDRGFFGRVTNATIKNLTLDTVTITGSRDYAGGVVGYAVGVSLTDCNVKNITVDVAGKSYYGGLAGYIATNASTITDCTVENAVFTGAQSIGGLVGRTAVATTISGCLAKNISITATSTYIGGAVGYAYSCDIDDTVVRGVYISSASTNAGAFIGETQGGATTVNNCSVEAIEKNTPNTVIGGNYIGGFLGRHYSGTAEINNCCVYNTQISSNGSYVGGFIGENYKAISFTNCIVDTVDVTSSKYTAGFIGYLSAACTVSGSTVTNSEITTTSSDSYTGGFVGYTNAKLTATECMVTNTNIDVIKAAGGFAGALGAGSAIEKSGVVDVSITSSVTASEDSNLGGFIGVCGWGTANTVSWSYAARVTLDAAGKNVGGFIGKTDNSAHIIKECYANAEINSTASYVGSFGGYKTSGTFTDCYASENEGLNAIGSDVADEIIIVSADAVKDGTLASMLEEISGIWKQYNDDYENGYPVIGEAHPPVVNEAGYYEIYTAYQLRWFMNYVNSSTANASADAVLMADINLNNREWTPIGNHSIQYAGTFDGNGFTVSNILIKTTSVDRGFFGKISSSAKIENLTLDTITIETKRDYTGGLVGVMNGGTVVNCHVKNVKISAAAAYVGGIAGLVESNAGVITDCSVENASLSGSGHVGGVIGRITVASSTVENCSAENITVSATDTYVGGFIGSMTANNTVENCNVTNVTAAGKQYVGGFMGYHSNTLTCTDCTVTGVAVNATSTSNGGFIGESAGAATFESCSVEKLGAQANTVSGTNYLGGFAGRVYSGDNTFTNCGVESIEISGTGYNVGGFMGENNSTVLLTNCYANDVVAAGTYNIGGFVGDSSATATYTACGVNTAVLTASNVSESNVGGFAGYTSAKATMTDCWVTDADVTGFVRVAGFVGALGGGSVIQKSYVLRSNIVSNATSTTTDAKIGGFAGTIGWDSAVTVNYCYVNDVTIETIGEEVGGFAGNMNNAAHTVSECYANAVKINSDSAYVGTFVGIKSSGTVNNCYASSVNSLPRIGSAAAGVEADNVTGITATNASEVADGTLCDLMNSVTTIWVQHNEDYENGWPEIDLTATEPLLSEDGYYEIYTAYQLEWFTKYVNAGNTSANARLMADIDLQKKAWKPIGSDSKKYAGTFDGNNCRIINLNISATTNDIGLFGSTTAAFRVQDLSVVNAAVTSTKSYIGVLVGLNRGSIENCSVEGLTVSGASYVGGLVGQNEGTATVIGCTVTGTESNNTISSTGEYAGGIVGRSAANPAIIRNCTVDSVVLSASQRVGGIAGDMSDSVLTVNNVFAKNIEINTQRYAGGLLYSLRGGSIMINCGSENITINCSATGAIECGGLVGLLNGGSSISNSYARGITLNTVGDNVGGLVGNADNGSISESWVYALSVYGTSNVATAIGKANTLRLMNSYYVGSYGKPAVGNGVEFNSLTAVSAQDVADNWFAFFEKQAATYTQEDVLAMSDEEFIKLYEFLAGHYNIVLFYDDEEYSEMCTENGFDVYALHAFMSMFILRYNIEQFEEFILAEDNILDSFFTDELLETDISALTTQVLLYDYYEAGRDLWDSLIKKYTEEAILPVLGEERFAQIESFLSDCFNELTLNRLKEQLNAVITPYEKEENRISIINFREIGNACSSIETVIYNELLDELNEEILEKYEQYLVIYEKYKNFISNDAFSVFESSTVDYNIRDVREDDVARETSPDEDYEVTQEKMEAIVDKIDNILLGDDFAYLLDLDEPLDDTLRTLISEELYNNDIINSLIESTYVLAAEELSEAIEKNAQIEVLGIKLTFRGKAKDVINSMVKSFGLSLLPNTLASIIDAEKYPQAVAVLNAAGGDWSKVELEDSTAENYLDWGVVDKDSFIDAVGNVFRGLYPAVRALLTTNSFSKSATEDVITGCDLKVNLTVNAVAAYDETIIPLFETLGIAQLTDSDTFNTYTSTDDYFDAILYPLFSWVEDSIASAPLSTISEMLPNLAYYMEFGYLEQWLRALATSISYDIDAVVDVIFDDVDIDITKGSLDFSVYELLAGEEDSILYSADLYSISGLIDVILSQMGVDVRLPVSANAYLASLGEMIEQPSANSEGTRYYVKANRADVMYVVLLYLMRALGNEEFIEQTLNSFSDDAQELDGELLQIVRNIGESPEDAVAAIVELCLPQEYDMITISTQTVEQVSISSVKYSPVWTRENAQFVVNNLSDFIDNVLYLLGMDGLEVMLSEMIGGEIYLNDNLTDIVITIRDLVTSVDDYEKILMLLNMDISSWLDIEEGHDWGFEDGDKDGFLDSLCIALAPVNNLLSFVLADSDIVILDGEITVNGAQGYAYGIIPILEALGCDKADIVSGEEYLSDACENEEMLLRNIIVPIFNMLDKVYADPAVELMELLPNLMYFIESGMLTDAIVNTLHSVFVLLDTIRPIYSIDLELDFDINSILSDLLSDVMSDTGFAIPADGNILNLFVGSVTESTSVTGETVYVIQGSGADILTVLLRYLLNVVFYEDNEFIIADIICEEIGLDASATELLKALFYTFDELINYAPYGQDHILAVFYWIYFGGYVGSSGAVILKDFVGIWEKLIELIKDCDCEILCQFCDKLKEVLNGDFDSWFESDNQSSIFGCSFFEKLFAWIKMIIDKITNFFNSIFR